MNKLSFNFLQLIPSVEQFSYRNLQQTLRRIEPKHSCVLLRFLKVAHKLPHEDDISVYIPEEKKEKEMIKLDYLSTFNA